MCICAVQAPHKSMCKKPRASPVQARASPPKTIICCPKCAIVSSVLLHKYCNETYIFLIVVNVMFLYVLQALGHYSDYIILYGITWHKGALTF